MQKKPAKKSISAKIILIFGLLVTGFGAASPSFADDLDNPADSSPSASQAEEVRVDRKFSLTYLLEPDGSKLVAESRRLEALLKDSKNYRSLPAARQNELRYAAGILRVYRYIRTAEKDDAFEAKKLLEQVRGDVTETDLFRVHIGMAHAFVAGIRTVFGVGDLKKMQAELQSIDRNHPDWLIRFLRGTTLVETGRALPGVFSIKDIKEEAVEVGSGDLRYVLNRPRGPGQPFDPDRYDPTDPTVPPPVREKARSVLEGE